MKVEPKIWVSGKHNSELPLYPLPLRIVQEEDLIAPYIKLAEHIMKRHAANVISGYTTDFREEIRKFIDQVQQESYSRGVKTANKIIEL